jgi:hypothetical protein
MEIKYQEPFFGLIGDDGGDDFEIEEDKNYYNEEEAVRKAIEESLKMI